MSIDLHSIRELAERAAAWARPWGEAKIDAGLGEGEPRAVLDDLFCSKTHVSLPAGRVVAWARLQNALGARAVGVDLEASARPVSGRVQERLGDARERELGLTPIQLWVVKEACFKAARPLRWDTVTQVRLLSWDPATGAGRWEQGSFWCQARGEWVLGLALLI